MSGFREGRFLLLLFFCVIDSFSIISLGEFFFYKEFLEHIGEVFFLNNLEGDVSVNRFFVEEVFFSSLEEEVLIKIDILFVLARIIEELEIFC